MVIQSGCMSGCLRGALWFLVQRLQLCSTYDMFRYGGYPKFQGTLEDHWVNPFRTVFSIILWGYSTNGPFGVPLFWIWISWITPNILMPAFSSRSSKSSGWQWAMGACFGGSSFRTAKCGRVIHRSAGGPNHPVGCAFSARGLANFLACIPKWRQKGWQSYVFAAMLSCLFELWR